MIAAAVNLSSHGGGVYLAGLANVSSATFVGFALAGAANIAGDDLEGVQISGLFNLANDVHGVQLGLINVARHLYGVQIGLINIAYENGLPFMVGINAGF
jgi:hypothetical protein